MPKQNNVSEDQARKGAFPTPQIWVRKSQEYLAKVFGENWQDEYYIWDCCCGTGNLLAGLVNPYNVWASTIDQADIDILHSSINNRKCNLLASHVFHFDFLNGNFDDLPEALRSIINDPEKQKRLIVYINPPYAEAMNKRDSKSSKKDVNRTQVEQKYGEFIGKSIREIYVQFFIRIAKEFPESRLASFSTLKYVSAKDNFKSSMLSDFLKSRKLSKEAQAVYDAGKAYGHITMKRFINSALRRSMLRFMKSANSSKDAMHKAE